MVTDALGMRDIITAGSSHTKRADAIGFIRPKWYLHNTNCLFRERQAAL